MHSSYAFFQPKLALWTGGVECCRRYSFLYEEAIPSEVKELKSHMKKAKTPYEKRQAQTKLSRLHETLKRHGDRKLEQEVRSAPQPMRVSATCEVEQGRASYGQGASFCF